MNTEQILDEILGRLRQVKESKSDLEQILQFLQENISLEEEEEEITCNIPELFKPLIPRIAEDIDCGMIAFINKETGEYESMLVEFYEDEFVDCKELWQEVIDKVDSWEDRIEVRPLHSSQSFRIMERFAKSLSAHPKIQAEIIRILNNKKPFAHFNHYIHNSPLREDWFSFKQAYLEKEVALILDNELNGYDFEDDSDDDEETKC